MRGAKVNITDNDGYTALMAATGKGYERLVVFLVDNGADINIRNHYDKTAIDLADGLEHHIIKHYLVIRVQLICKYISTIVHIMVDPINIVKQSLEFLDI